MKISRDPLKKSTLIIIRGNSGSGKTTIAKELQVILGSVLLISQDVVRRDMLNSKDTEGNPSIALIKHLALYGRSTVAYVIIEGILSEKRYSDIFRELALAFGNHTLAVYLDISFEETLRRHQTKDHNAEFGEREMKRWWLEHDYLGNEKGFIFTDNDTQTEIIDAMLEYLRSPQAK